MKISMESTKRGQRKKDGRSKNRRRNTEQQRQGWRKQSGLTSVETSNTKTEKIL